MTLLWLPAAVRDPHPRSFPWQERTDPKGCLHTTETSGWPSYDGWTIMPHATVMPTAGKGVTIRQHLPFDQASFALAHTRSQPTGGDYVLQFELVGTCAQGGPGYYWPAADDAVLLDLYVKVMRPLVAGFGIPLRARPFLPYPSSYGASSVRMTDSAYDTYSGWLGHQHVPQNDHGDPGAFPWSRLAALAAEYEQEQDMPTAAEIAKAVWDQPVPDPWDGTPGSAASMLGSARFYAIQSGHDGTTPSTASTAPGQQTLAGRLVDATGSIEESVAELQQAMIGVQGDLAAQGVKLQQLLDAVAALAARLP